MSSDDNFLESVRKVFRDYKKLGEGAIAQLTDEQVLSRPDDASNSIAIIVHHLSGNMLSRWTDFLTSDGEKSWRNRVAEFEVAYPDKKAMMEAWEKGWRCVLDAVDNLKPEDLSKVTYIRNAGQPAVEAVLRHLAHYSYHVGQIIFQAKLLQGSAFLALTVPKGNQGMYKEVKSNQEKK